MDVKYLPLLIAHPPIPAITHWHTRHIWLSNTMALLLLCFIFPLLLPSSSTAHVYTYNGMYQLDDPASGSLNCRSPNPLTGNCSCQVTGSPET